MKAMKHILFSLIFLCIASCVSAQHYTIPVKQLDSTDTEAFRHHPDTVDVDIVDMKIIGYADSLRYITCKVVTSYEEDITGIPFYIAKRTTTESMVKLPLSEDIINAFDMSGAINEVAVNKILAYFKLQVNHEALIGANANQ